jgi:hypothetical protein
MIQNSDAKWTYQTSALIPLCYGKPGVTHNPDKPLLASMNNLRIVSTNRCSGKYKHKHNAQVTQGFT